MTVTNNKLKTELTKTMIQRLVSENPGKDIPQTSEAFNAVLDAIRPDGHPHVWKGCRYRLSESLGVKVNGTFHAWFDLMAAAE